MRFSHGHVFVLGARLTWVLSGCVTHAQCASPGHIYSASVLWNFSCQWRFFLRFLPILSEGLDQVKFLNILKIGKILMSLSKFRLAM